MTNGSVTAELDDGSNYTELDGGTINDGHSHDVLVERKAGELRIFVDCTQVASAFQPRRLPRWLSSRRTLTRASGPMVPSTWLGSLEKFV